MAWVEDGELDAAVRRDLPVDRERLIPHPTPEKVPAILILTILFTIGCGVVRLLRAFHTSH